MMDTAPTEKKSRFFGQGKTFIVPLSIFIGLLMIWIISSRFIEHPPFIRDISPSVALPGDILILHGTSFGDERQGGEIVIGGIRPSSSSYIEWTDTRISVRIPENAGSGEVAVRKRNSTSNGVLFTNRNHIPVPARDMYPVGMPLVTEILPANGSIGDVITLYGLNFGDIQGSGKVYFTAVSTPRSESSRISADHPENMIPCSENDFDYLLWADQEIRIQVPFGATSGNIVVRTEHGDSAGGYFEISQTVGSFVYSEPRGYQIQYSVSVEDVISTSPNRLNLWIPAVHPGLEQQNIEILSDPVSLWSNYKGIMRFSLEELEPLRKYSILQTIWFDRFRIDTKINTSKIPSSYNRDSLLYKTYTSPSSIVPSDIKRVADIAKAQTARVTNPHTKAYTLYLYLLNNFSFSEEGTGSVERFLDEKKGNAYDYACLYSALTRGAGIPSRVVSGILIFGNKKTRPHFWNEFFIPGFGWFPVDPVLGDGITFENFPQSADPRKEYFGNLDNQRITFSRGLTTIQRTDPESRVIYRKGHYSLQTIHEEIMGNIQSYTSLWSEVRLVDLW